MGDKCNLHTWNSIPLDRQEALKRVFELYSVKPIDQSILNNLDPLGVQYRLGMCHQNSMLLALQYLSQLECVLVEGIAINANGEAFEHYWNKFKTIPSNSELPDEGEYDVTHDLLMPGQPPFLYHAVKEYKITEISNGAKMSFSEETEKKLKEYLAIVPDAKPIKSISKMMNLYDWKQCPVSIFIKFRDKYSDSKYEECKVYCVSEGETHRDAFASSGKIIFYDAHLCKNKNLTEEECFACTAHEIGHIFDSTHNDEAHHKERELNADKKVIELGLQEHLISALKKLCANDTPEQKILTDKRIKVLEESLNR